MSEPGRPRGRRRRAVFISEVDRRLLEAGLPPSWEDRVGGVDAVAPDPEDVRSGGVQGPDRGDGANDARLLENVPPHAQPRA